MIARGITGRTFSPPGSLFTRAISAEASSTTSGKGGILPAGFPQLVHQADALGDIAPGYLLGLPDGLVQCRDLDAVLRPAENAPHAIFDAEVPSQFSRQDNAPRT